MNLKKLLSRLSLLTSVISASLSATACGNDHITQTKINNKKNISTEKQVIEQLKKDFPVAINTPIKTLENSIKSIFQSQLKEKNKFIFKSLTNDKNQKLSDDDLKVAKVINAKVHYNYESNKDQTINLTITVINENKNNIAQKISTTPYSTEVNTSTKAIDFIKTINSTFIKGKLSEEDQKYFDASKLKINKILINKKDELNDSNLKTSNKINATIDFSYNNTNEHAKLTINVINKEETAKNIKVLLKDINKKSWKTNVNLNSTIEELQTKIKNDIIEKLSEIPGFNSEKAIFEYSKLKNLNLKKPGEINSTIKINYESIKNQEIKLTINVTDQDTPMINKIINTSYKTEVNTDTKGIDFVKTINSDFIKKRLSKENQKHFDASKLKINKITKQRLIYGTQNLENYNFNKVEKFDAKIHFTYGSEKEYTTNLTINVTNQNKIIAETIMKKPYQKTISIGTTVIELKKLIETEMSNQSSNIPNFNKDKLQIKKLSKKYSIKNANILIDSDLQKPKTFTVLVPFSYGNIPKTAKYKINIH